jgi:RNA polymerase sigma-70 factor (ECF subfamily)
MPIAAKPNPHRASPLPPAPALGDLGQTRAPSRVGHPPRPVQSPAIPDTCDSLGTLGPETTPWLWRMTRQAEVSERPDSELLRAAVDGDVPALTTLYERHIDGLFAFVLFRVGRNPHLAEDVVQDSFLYALDHARSFDPSRGTFRAWLHTSSRNLIRKHLETNRETEKLEATWARIDASLVQVFAALAEAPLGEEVLEREETRDLVHMTIANLPERYRLALEHKYLRGESLSELAERFSLTEAAAKSLLARARLAFRETFDTMVTAFAEVSDA